MNENGLFISVRGRILLNAEALNMTESVGNYVKHRRVPVVIERDGEYVTLYVPAVSGESIAHGYQYLLAKESANRNIPVCKLCAKGIFLKSANNDTVKHSHGFDPANVENSHDFERKIIQGCVVEDIGGFLYAPGRTRGKVKQVKRTSNFYVGYMIPVREALSNAVIESQLHTRYALGTEFVEKKTESQDRGQMIYYVEIASAPYVFSFDLDTKYIGKTTYDIDHVGEPTVSEEERYSRIEAAIKALTTLIMELGFGAKKTRYLPTLEWESLVVAVSNNVWTVPSPFSRNYIDAARKKVNAVNESTSLFIYERGGSKSLEEVLKEAEEEAIKRAKKVG